MRDWRENEKRNWEEKKTREDTYYFKWTIEKSKKFRSFDET